MIRRSKIGEVAVLVSVLVLGGFQLASALRRPAPAAASAGEVSGQAPERSLHLLPTPFSTDQGTAFRLSELQGRFVVLALVFTRCPSTCPVLVKDLVSLEQRMPADVRAATRFVLLTIDPEHDTPETLRAFRSKFALGDRWLLLRGTADDVRQLAALIGFSYGQSSPGELVHSKLVTLLDPSGEVMLQRPGAPGDLQRFIDAIQRRGAARPG